MAEDLLTASLPVMAHGDRPEVAEAFVKLLGDLPVDDATSLFSYTVDMAAPRARRLLEDNVTTYITKNSPWAQNLYREGREEGREEGRAAGEAASVLSVLRFRGIEVPPARHRQISTCTDLALLDTWLRRALDAAHIDDLFDDAPGPEPRS